MVAGWEESGCLGIRKIDEVDRCVVCLPNARTSKFIVSAHLNLKICILCSCLMFDVSQSTGSLGKDQPKEEGCSILTAIQRLGQFSLACVLEIIIMSIFKNGSLDIRRTCSQHNIIGTRPCLRALGRVEKNEIQKNVGSIGVGVF